MGTHRKYYFLAGIIAFLGLIILAVVFYKERVAFCDTAYQAVYLLIEQKPYINWVRAGSIIPQFIPLVAIWLHAGLKTVLVLHSLSFLVLFLAIYLAAYSYSDKKLIFFTIPLYLLLITTEVFYWPQSELQQGMIWLGLYAVLVFEKKWDGINPWIAWPIHFIFILWIQFFHPLLVFPIAFLIIYFYDSESALFTRKSMYHLFVCVVCFIIRDIVGMFNTYEKEKLDIGGALRKNLPHFLSLDSVHVFYHKMFTAYLIYVLLAASTIIWLMLHKKYLRLITLSGFSFCYWILIMASFSTDARFYTENMLLPLGFIVALPVAADIIPSFKSNYVPALFLILMLIRLGTIYHAHTDYTARFSIYQPYFDYVKANKLNGVLVDEKLIDKNRAIITWGSGYESVLISSLVSPDSCRVVQIHYDPNQLSWGLDADTALVTIFGVWNETRLPKQYFRLQHGKYKMLIKPQ